MKQEIALIFTTILQFSLQDCGMQHYKAFEAFQTHNDVTNQIGILKQSEKNVSSEMELFKTLFRKGAYLKVNSLFASLGDFSKADFEHLTSLKRTT